MQWQDVVPHLTGLAHLATVTPDGRPAALVWQPGAEVAVHAEFVLLRLAPTAATILEHTEHGPTRRRWTSGPA